jgi:hypothetical protein
LSTLKSTEYDIAQNIQESGHIAAKALGLCKGYFYKNKEGIPKLSWNERMHDYQVLKITLEHLVSVVHILFSQTKISL